MIKAEFQPKKIYLKMGFVEEVFTFQRVEKIGC